MLSFWAAVKNRYTWSVWSQKKVQSKIKSKTYPTSPAIGPTRIAPVFGRRKKTQEHPSLPTLLDFQLFFCCFSAHQSFSIVPPYAAYTNANVRGDPFHHPRPTPHLMSNTRIFCLLRGGPTQLQHRRIDGAYLNFGCSRRTAVCGHSANWYPFVVPAIYVSR